ncbi:putative bifunctional diguanylate cyclase/phosphodiesterase [Sulfuricaulis limicola]|nr:EAL domain-containing protein [Sulfuricaulis limicola]
MKYWRQLFRDMPIKRKLVLISMSSTGVALLLVTILLLVNEYYSYQRALLDDVRVQTAMIAENSTAALVFRDRSGAQEILGALAASPSIEQAALYTADGKTLALYRRKDQARTEVPDRPVTGHRFSSQHLELAHEIELNGEIVGTVYLRSDLERLYVRIMWYVGAIVLTAAGAMLAAFLLISLLHRGISGPLARLVDLMRQISERKDYSSRARVETRDEVGALAEGFNAMLGQIERHQADLMQELGERKRAEQRLDQLAYYDTITQLPNRHFFNEQLKLVLARAQRTGQRAGLMFLDLDNFKIINDTLGHDIGDVLLQGVAKRLREHLRTGDIICRIGGDEFAVIVEDMTDREQAAIVAEKIIGAFAHSLRLEGHEIYISASIGISLFPEDATEMHALLRNADTAMYFAKERGKNTYQFFLPEMNGRALNRLTLETSLRHALEREEFEVYYQPQFDLASKRLFGVEALLRWHRPDVGIVNPTEFIPVAEESGQIVSIGEWVLRQACAQAQAWQALVPGLTVSVNISSRQFHDSQLVDRILEILRQTGLAPELLTLELTEGVLMESSGTASTTLERLEAAGVKLSIDDFGTGYSSMGYLKRFPISTLKIDQGFMREVPADRDNVAIVMAIIAMCQSLKLYVIAEGVENMAQLEFLRKAGPVGVQGFYLSRPLTADATAALLQITHEERITLLALADGGTPPNPRGQSQG